MKHIAVLDSIFGGLSCTLIFEIGVEDDVSKDIKTIAKIAALSCKNIKNNEAQEIITETYENCAADNHSCLFALDIQGDDYAIYKDCY